jgi:hypothetical protein
LAKEGKWALPLAENLAIKTRSDAFVIQRHGDQRKAASNEFFIAWVSVRRNAGKYIAAAGKETFDVEMNITLTDGAILSGSLDNVVETRERDCADAALMNCGETRSRRILRQIQISLDR